MALQDKQLDTLIGISRSMEKSLHAIEAKNSNGGAGSAPGAPSQSSASPVAALASMATSISAITDALNVKNTNLDKNGAMILDFLHGLVVVADKVDVAKLDSLGAASNSITKFVDSFSNMSLMGIAKIMLATKLLFDGDKSVVKRLITGAIKTVESFSDKELKKLKTAGEGIAILGLALTTLGKALSTLALVAVISPLVLVGAGVAWLVVKMFTIIGEKLKETKAGYEAIGIIGKGLFLLAGGLAAMALLVALVPMKLLVEAALVTLAFVGIFAILGKIGDKIEAGAKAIKDMGVALIALSVGIAVMALVTMLVPPKNLLMGIALLITYAAAFWLIGKLSGDIAKGALTIILGIGIGLFFFSAALLLMAYTFQKLSIGDAFMAILLVAAFGAAFAILGVFGPTIEAGALAIAAIGAGMIIFSIGLIIFGLAIKGVIALFKNDWKIASIAAGGILLGFGLAFAGIGLLALPIALGGAAVAMIGAGLVIFSVGLLVFSLSMKAVMALKMYDDKKGEFLGTNLIINIAEGFAKVGTHAIGILLGAPLVAALGVSLLFLSVGLLAAAAAISKLPSKPSDFTDKIFGDGKGIMGIVPAIAQGFVDIYTKYKGDTGILGGLRALTGTTPLQLGIRMVSGMGDILREVAGGIAAFGDPDNFPVQIPDGKGGLKWGSANLGELTQSLIKNVGGPNGVLMSIASVFGNLGAKYGGNFFADSNIKKGVDSVKGIGGVLSELAGGIAAFSDPDNFPAQQPDGKGNLKWVELKLSTVLPKITSTLIGTGGIDGNGLLYALAKVFANIADAYPSGFLGMGKGKVALGVNSVKEMGSVISSLATGITAFAAFDHFPTKWDAKGNPIAWTNLDMKKVANKITTILTLLPSVFATIDIDSFKKQQDKADVALSMTDVLKDIATNISKIDSIYSKMKPIVRNKVVTDSISLLGSSISEMATTISTSLNTDNLDKLNRLSNIFGDLSKSSQNFNVFVTAFTRLQDPFAKFANTLGILASNFGVLNKNFDNYVKFVNLNNSMADRSAKYVSLSSPFEKLAVHTGTFADNINKLSERSIANLEKTIGELKKMVEIDVTKFSTIANSAKTIADAAASTQANMPVTTAANKPGATHPNTPASMSMLITEIQTLTQQLKMTMIALSADKTATGNLKGVLETWIAKHPD